MKKLRHQLHHGKPKNALYALILIMLILISTISWFLWPHPSNTPGKTVATTDSSSNHKNTTSLTQKKTKESSQIDSSKEMTYALTPEQLRTKMTFQLAQPDSPNMPTYVVLYFEKDDTGKAEIVFKKSEGQDSTANEKFTLSEIPTKEIRIFPAFNHPTDEQSLRNSIRTVKVNTELTLHSGDKMYLFVNGNQGISLITKNFAGNVPQDLTDVYVESFEEKIYQQTLDDSNKEKIAQYKKLIEDAFIAQQNYAETLDSSDKESVQSPQAAAVAKATELGIAHPEDNELIQKALSEFHE